VFILLFFSPSIFPLAPFWKCFCSRDTRVRHRNLTVIEQNLSSRHWILSIHRFWYLLDICMIYLCRKNWNCFKDGYFLMDFKRYSLPLGFCFCFVATEVFFTMRKFGAVIGKGFHYNFKSSEFIILNILPWMIQRNKNWITGDSVYFRQHISRWRTSFYFCLT